MCADWEQMENNMFVFISMINYSLGISVISGYFEREYSIIKQKKIMIWTKINILLLLE